MNVQIGGNLHLRMDKVEVVSSVHIQSTSLVGYAFNFNRIDNHQFFIGIGTLIAAFTIATGWENIFFVSGKLKTETINAPRLLDTIIFITVRVCYRPGVCKFGM